MNMLASEACDLASSLVKKPVDGVDVVISPPFTSLYPVSQIIKGSKIALAGQNFYFESKGAFTGEVSLEMLRDTGCSYALIGHSERRQLFGESNEDVNKKVLHAIKLGVIPVVCVGETLQQREAGSALDVIHTQLMKGLAGLPANSKSLPVVAYEPVWAIGTGVNARPDQAVEVHKFIRELLVEKLEISKKHEARILYGGSVTAENCKELMSEEEIDGALVGGSSLKLDSFYAIIKSSLESR